MNPVERARGIAHSLSARLRAAAAAALAELTRESAPSPASAARPSLAEITRRIGDDWTQAPYYDDAEKYMDRAWADLIWPFIHDCDFSTVVDLAAGHGRNTEKLRPLAGTVHVADINQSNIDFCRQRFAGDRRVRYHLCDGTALPDIAGGSVSLIYCFDAMVHFDCDTVRAYLKDFFRLLRPGGRGFCHHSNFTGNPAGDFHQSDHWRNFMSKELFEHYCYKEGLTVIRSKVIDWNRPQLDCLTLFEKQ